jgi:hypothetical protein
MKRKKSSVSAFLSHRSGSAALALLLLLAGCGQLIAAPFHSSDPGSQKRTAPKDYALIVGTVWGADNRPLAGVPINIHSATGKKAKWELVSDARGEFAQRVPPGRQDYIIQANIKTPKGQPKPEITVQIEDNERKDVGLHLTQQGPAKQ